MRRPSGGREPRPRRPEPDRKSGRASGRRSGANEFAGLGLTLGLAIAAFALAGNWLDGKLGTTPLFVLLGVFLGFGGGFYSIYSRLVLRHRRGESGDRPQESDERRGKPE